MKTILTTLTLCSCLSFPLFAQNADLESMNTEAYLSMMDADKLLEEKKGAEALKYYQKSLESYQALKQQDPSFKPKIVEYRIEVLTGKIAALQQELPDSATAGSPAADPVTAPAGEDYKMLYLQAREKMVKDSTRLLTLEKQTMQMNTTLKERQDEIRRLQGVLNSMERDLNQAKNEQVRATAALEKEVKDLSRFNNLLQERADKIELSAGELEKQRDALLVDGRALSEKFANLETANNTLQQELEEARRGAKLTEQRLIISRNQLQDDLALREKDLALQIEKNKALQASVTELQKLEATVASLETKSAEQQKELMSLNAVLASAKAAADEAKKNLEQSTTEKQQLMDQLAELQAEKATWKEKLDAAIAEKDSFEKQVNATEREKTRLQKQMERHQNAKEDAEKEEARAIAAEDELKDKIKTLTSENKNLEKEMDRLLKGAGSWKGEKERLVDALAKRQLETKAMESELATLQRQYKEDTNGLSKLQQESGEWKEQNAKLQETLKGKNADMEILAQEVSKLRTEISKNAVNQGQLEMKLEKATAELSESSEENKRLALNLQQESEQRRRLEKNAEQQLDTITDRMNEIISLRQKISKLEADLKKAKSAE